MVFINLSDKQGGFQLVVSGSQLDFSFDETSSDGFFMIWRAVIISLLNWAFQILELFEFVDALGIEFGRNTVLALSGDYQGEAVVQTEAEINQLHV